MQGTQRKEHVSEKELTVSVLPPIIILPQLLLKVNCIVIHCIIIQQKTPPLRSVSCSTYPSQRVELLLPLLKTRWWRCWELNPGVPTDMVNCSTSPQGSYLTPPKSHHGTPVCPKRGGFCHVILYQNKRELSSPL